MHSTTRRRHVGEEDECRCSSCQDGSVPDWLPALWEHDRAGKEDAPSSAA